MMLFTALYYFLLGKSYWIFTFILLLATLERRTERFSVFCLMMTSIPTKSFVCPLNFHHPRQLTHYRPLHLSELALFLRMRVCVCVCVRNADSRFPFLLHTPLNFRLYGPLVSALSLATGNIAFLVSQDNNS